MGAGSKFDQPLTLIEDGHKVIACGPLRFWACDARAEVTIQLRQGAHRAVTTKMFPNTNFDEDGGEVAVGDEEDDEWMMRATVEPYPMHKGLRSVDWGSAAFAPGEVHGHGIIKYYRGNGGGNTKSWVRDLDARWQ